MPQLKVAVQLASLRLPLRRALEAAAEIRADAVELEARGDLHPQKLSRTGIRQIRKWIEDYGLRVCAISFPTRRGYEEVENLDARIQATKDAMRLAFEFGAPTVVNQIGHIGPDDSPQRQLLQEALLDLGQFSQHAGALLAAETGAESGPRLAALIQSLPDGYLSVAFNPGKLIVHGFSVQEALDALGPHILYVRATDGVRDLAQGRGLQVPLGRGTADYAEIVGRLEEFGYRGYFTVLRQDAEDPRAELAAAVQYLRSL